MSADGRLPARLAGRRRGVALLAAVALVPLAGTGLAAAQPALAATAASTAAASTAAPAATLPDMQLLVPVSDISIGTNPQTGDRQLQFEHVTWDAGRGPFEIDPTFDAATGISSFSQAIYDSPKPGVWDFDYPVPLGGYGVYDPPSDYRFPLNAFTLNQVTGDGSAGRVVRTSPKTDFCITGDTFVGGVPNTPPVTYIPQSNCTNPGDPLGWSVGWGDEYDQTDPGQPIDLTGVPDGTYILQGIVDPQHLLTESNRDNDVVDTTLAISGDTVTVLSQTRPKVVPPRVTLTGPAAGARVSGTVTLAATASAPALAKVSSVQFLLDGRPLGGPDRTAPYRIRWRVGSTPLGRHQLSARVTNSAGSMGTAPVRTVTIVPARSAGPALAAVVSKTGLGTVTTRRFSTSSAGQTLLALVGSDGPAGRGQQSVTVVGAHLKWRLVKRNNGRSGDAEIWAATASRRLSNVTVRSAQRHAGYDQQLTVLAFGQAGGVGAASAASAASGAPGVHLRSTVPGSLAVAVGNDYDNAISRTVGPGQQLISQWVDTGTGDTYWVQDRTGPSRTAHQLELLNDTAPAADQWNLAAVEVKPARKKPARPAVSLVNPAPGQLVSGTIPVAAYASDTISLRSVRFFLDGRPLGKPVTAPPFAVRWRTTALPDGRYTLTARATGAGGLAAAARRVVVTVRNPPPYPACFIMQTASAHGRGEVTTPAFHTAAPGETLLAFVSSGGPAGQRRQRVTVSGAGLRWRLVSRANAQPGDAEIWRATAGRVMPAARVTARQAIAGYPEQLTVIAMQGTDGAGAAAAASGPAGPAVLRLTTTQDGSLIFAVGHQQAGLAARLPFGWVALARRPGGAAWAQYTNVPAGEAGTAVRVAERAAAGLRWNLAAVELTADSD